MKKICFILLSLAFAFMAVGCGRKTEAPTTSKTKLVEHQAPTIVAQDVTIAVNERFVPTRYATATDEDGTDISADIEYTGNVDYTKAGTYQATYTVTDKNGMTATKTITVKVVSSDKEAPLLSGAGNVTVPITGDFDPKAGVKAIDTVDGDISSKIQVIGEVDVKHLGEYTLKYTVTDEAGNKAPCPASARTAARASARAAIETAARAAARAGVFVRMPYVPCSPGAASENERSFAH